MQNGKLTRDDATALLTKLATDDSFRTVFEKDPSAGLKQLGIGGGDIANLPSAATTPASLAPKAQFQEALDQIRATGTSDHICLIIPALKLAYGDAGGTKRS